MCDYSLDHQSSRLAQAGDRLRTTTFQNSTTKGFCSTEDSSIVVCLPVGTEIAFETAPLEEGPFGFFVRAFQPNRLTARFKRVNESEPYAHHDALEFSDGHVVLLTRLRPGQYATVIQLPRLDGIKPTVREMTEDDFSLVM